VTNQVVSFLQDGNVKSKSSFWCVSVCGRLAVLALSIGPMAKAGKKLTRTMWNRVIKEYAPALRLLGINPEHLIAKKPAKQPWSNPSVAPVPSSEEWKERILKAYERRRTELCRKRITRASQALKEQFGTARDEPPRLRYIEKVLRECTEDFAKFGGSKQRPK